MLALFQGQREAVLEIAGVLIFLPQLAFDLFVPDLQLGEVQEEMVHALTLYVETHWSKIIALALFSAFGTLSLLVLLLGKERPSPAEAMTRGLKLLPSALLVWVMTGMIALLGVSLITIVTRALQSIVGAGANAVTIPALMIFLIYINGRLLLSQPALVSDGQANPANALGRALMLSRGRGWLLGSWFMFLVLGVSILGIILTGLIGALASVLPQTAGEIITALLAAVVASLSGLATTLYGAAAYRALDR
jgi:hypothetical protein